jgi:hypothetical protein
MADRKELPPSSSSDSCGYMQPCQGLLWYLACSFEVVISILSSRLVFVFYHPFQICEALHYAPLIIKFHINNTILLLRNYCFAKFLDLYIYFTTDYKTKTQYCLIDAGLVGDA